MKRWKSVIIYILFALLLFGFFKFKDYAESVKDEHCFTTRISSRIFDFNKFDVYTTGDLDINDFKVEYLNSGKIIFQNGISSKGIKNEYGKCMFRLYYQDSLIYDLGHKKNNNWHTNDYLLFLETDSGKIAPRLKIFGVDSKSEVFLTQY